MFTYPRVTTKGVCTHPLLPPVGKALTVIFRIDHLNLFFHDHVHTSNKNTTIFHPLLPNYFHVAKHGDELMEKVIFLELSEIELYLKNIRQEIKDKMNKV